MTEPRRAHRPAEHRLVAGVATGVAEHLAVPVLWVRVAFVVATWFNGAGIIAYLLLWRFLPLRTPDLPPGLDAATRRGARGSGRPGVLEVVQTVAVLALGAGVLLLLAVLGLGIPGGLLVPLLVAVVGVALVWRQLDDAAGDSWLRQTHGWAFVARVAGGITLVGFAAVYLLTQERGFGALRDLGSALGIALVGLVLILGPWIITLVTNLGSERRERIRSQERADVAAHLHDSVLQTLALLQKNAGDAASVATLARRQERELRAWLYGDETQHGDTLAAAMRHVVTEVEEAHRVPVELIVVGDVALDPDVSALVRAAREAVVNAARHAGVDRIDVYVETDGRHVDVFVRDRGVGFDPASVGEDRMGLRGSIVERVERHGGRAEIRSEIGGGTEVRLALPVRGATQARTAPDTDAPTPTPTAAPTEEIHP